MKTTTDTGRHESKKHVRTRQRLCVDRGRRAGVARRWERRDVVRRARCRGKSSKRLSGIVVTGRSREDDDEEDNRLSLQQVFIVDPIDGTRAFTKGSRNFTISAALVESGALVAAAVFAPAHDELYAAALDQGTTMNGEIVQPSMRKQLDGASVLMREVDLNDRYWRGGAPALCRDTIGSIALRICRAAAGAVDGALSLRPAKEWDVAGGVLIAGEAGATVSNRRGKKLFFNQKKPEVDGLIAACAPLHRAILARLK